MKQSPEVGGKRPVKTEMVDDLPKIEQKSVSENSALAGILHERES